MSSEHTTREGSSRDDRPPDTTYERAPALRGQSTAIILVAVVAAVIVGAVAATLLFGLPGGEDNTEADGSVAVVSIEGLIAGSIDEELEGELRDIRADDSIDAVVLEMDTPGGSPATTERMYKSIQRTSEEKPVIASVQEMSASAGYYMMLPSEEIYVLPTSMVGSVGLNAIAPPTSPPVEGPSGPDKAGMHPTHGWAELETLGDIFIETVMEQRGDRIELSREEVATAQVFTGVDSVENGYADEIGSLDRAVADAADRAGLETYTIDNRSIGAQDDIPLFAQTDYGMVAIHDENPTIADVEVLEYAMVYEPAVPHIEELEAVTSSGVEELAAEIAEQDAAEEERGEQP